MLENGHTQYMLMMVINSGGGVTNLQLIYLYGEMLPILDSPLIDRSMQIKFRNSIDSCTGCTQKKVLILPSLLYK